MDNLQAALEAQGLEARLTNTGGGVMVNTVRIGNYVIGVDLFSVCLYTINDQELEDERPILLLDETTKYETRIAALAAAAKDTADKLDKITEPLFIYAGHTCGIRVYRDELEDGVFTKDYLLEVNSFWARELIEDEAILGIYPKHFAEYEALDIIIGRITDKNAGSSLKLTETLAREAIKEIIKDGVFAGVN